MKALSPRAKDTLSAYRRAEAMPATVRGAALARVSARLALPAVTSVPSVGARPPTPRIVRTLRWAGPLSTLLLGFAAWWLLAPGKPLATARPLEPRALETDAPLRDRPAPVRTAASPAARELVSPERASPAPVVPIRTQRKHAPPRTGSASDGRALSGTVLVAQLPASAERDVSSVGSEPGRVPLLLATPRSQLQLTAASVDAISASVETARERNGRAGTLDDEVMQMRAAYDLLRNGDALRALSALSEHARRFPEGELAAMRQSARVQALCDLGKRREASEEAARFLAAHGDSAYAARVRRICAETSPANR